MADDQTFRLILALGMAAFLPVALYHRIRSQASGEKLDRRQEGPFILFTLRPCGLAAIGGLVAFVLHPAWMSWASVPLPAALRWAGVGIGLPAVALGIWTFRSLGRNITDTVVTRREHTLVFSGPYRYVRQQSRPSRNSLPLSRRQRDHGSGPSRGRVFTGGPDAIDVVGRGGCR